MEINKIKMAKTQYLGKEIIYYEEIESTQEEAKRRILSQISNGAIIITDNQKNGKGTKGRKWYTTKESNITMTIALYPNCEIKQLEGITLKIAKAMLDAIQELYQIPLTIKEPNDLMLQGKKIAGILTQSASYEEKVKYLLVGIGFNVNEMNFSPEIQEIATSLKKEYQKEFNTEDIIVNFIEKFETLLMEDKII